MAHFIPDLSIDELWLRKFLSTRSANVCRTLRLNTLKDIIQYQAQNKSFSSALNCGVRSAEELLNLCEKFRDPEDQIKRDQEIINANNELKSICQALTELKTLILKRRFEFLFTRLSERARDALSDLSVRQDEGDLLDIVLSSTFSQGSKIVEERKMEQEIRELKSTVTHFIADLAVAAENQLTPVYIQTVRQMAGIDAAKIKPSYTEKLMDAAGKLKLFYLASLVVQFGNALNKNQATIFKHLYFQAASFSKLAAIGEALNLTRERVRQIKENLVKTTVDRLSFIANFKNTELVSYGLENIEFFRIFDLTYFEKINKQEETHFNPYFYFKIIPYLLQNKYAFFNEAFNRTAKRQFFHAEQLKRYYLISVDILECFNFKMFYEDALLKTRAKTTAILHIPLKDYLLPFYARQEKSVADAVQKICQQMLFLEFGLTPDSSGYITFKRTLHIQLYEYCYEALEELAKPSKAEEIKKSIDEKHPDRQFTVFSVKEAILRKKDLFVFLGTTGLYGLKKWEKEKNLIVGSIRSIAATFLADADEPKRLSEIADYVKLHRKTTLKSVCNNIRSDQNGIFVFFEGSKAGLSSKKYADSYEPSFQNRKKWIQIYDELVVFRKNNPNRWPSRASKNRDERLMFNLGYKARTLFKLNKLPEDKIELLRKIDFPLQRAVSKS